MSNFIKNIEQQKEKRERNRLSRQELGKYFFDLSKLSFGAMVLGVIVPWLTESDSPYYLILLVIGIFCTSCLAFFGYKIIKN